MTAGIMHSPTVRRIVGPTILLASGSYFDFLAPEQSEFTIEDIAHGLSNVCRFTGQCSRFYSVAQHSVLVSRIVPPEDAYAALMHDAAEALIGDVSKPLKDMLPDYRKIEKAVEAAVFARFGVPTLMPSSVKTADVVMLATEQHALMPDREGRSYAGGHAPLDIDIPPMSPAAAKSAFLARYAELTGASAPTPDLGAQGELVPDLLARLGEPHCWVVPGQDTANANGYIDAHCCQEGEMSKPLWPLEAIRAAGVELPAASRPGSGVSVEDLKTILNVWHQSACYPSASDGELRICAEQILTLFAQAPRDGGETQDETEAAIRNCAEAVAFFDQVRAASDREQVAVGRDHWNWLESAARRVAACSPPSGVETIRQDNTSGGL